MNRVTKERVTRRMLLRGAAWGGLSTLGIPLLECMGEGVGEAFAQSLNPVGFGIFFWGGGLPWHPLSDPASRSGDVDIYTPPGGIGGTPLQMSELLQPLTPSRSNINVVTGLNPWLISKRQLHEVGQSAALTGAPVVAGGSDGPKGYTYSQPSIDRVVAKTPGFYTRTPNRSSVHLCAATRVFLSHSGWNAISMDGPNQRLVPTVDPQQFYREMFGGPVSVKEQSNLTSALDVVAEDARALQATLGKDDRERMQSHLDALSSIEGRLKSGALSCTAPKAPDAKLTSGWADAALGQQVTVLRPRFELLTDILVAALACNVTRVFSFMLTGGAHPYAISPLGIPLGPGAQANHGAQHAGNRGCVIGNALYSFTALQYLLDRLSKTKGPTGSSLLDNMLIYATSEYSAGWHHTTAEYPILLAGKAGGRMKTGMHVRIPGGNICDAQLTILRALGLNVAEFGAGAARSTSPLPGLLA